MPSPSLITHALPGDELEDIVDQFLSSTANAPFDTWLLLPTKRLVNAVRDMLDERNVAYCHSRICTVEDFCRNCLEENRGKTRYLSPAESRILLTRVLMEHREELPMFFSRNHPLPGTLDNLLTFISVITRRKVAFPGCLLELQGEKSAQIALGITAYRRSQKDLDVVDADTIMEWTIEHLGNPGSRVPEHVFLYGIFRPLPLEQELLRLLRDRALSFRCVVPAGLDPGVFDDPLEWMGGLNTSSPFCPKPSIHLHLTGIFSQDAPVDTGGAVRLDTFTTHDAELHGIAQEICRLYASGTPLAEISVAFPEVRQELGMIDEVFADYGIPWNAKVSPLLSKYPLVRFMTGIIAAVANRYTREDIVQIFSSPYFVQCPSKDYTRCLEPEELDLISRYALIEGDRKRWLDRFDALALSLSDPAGRKIRGISPRTVERVKSGVLDLFGSLQALEGKKSVREFIRIYRNILDTYCLPSRSYHGDDEDRGRDQEIHHTFLARLDALAWSPWLFPGRDVTTEEFLRIVLTIAEEPDGPGAMGKDGVSVLGIRECAHQHFPYLFICGLVEGAVPRLTTRLPFTNSLENARMGTRSLADVLHEEEYHFITALLAGNTVYLSAPKAEGEKPLLTSAFFEHVRDRCNPPAWNTPLAGGIPASRISAATGAGERIGAGLVCESRYLADREQTITDLVDRINMERYFRTGLPDSPFDGVLSGDDQIASSLLGRYGPDQVYSATTLETYAQCPFRFFLRFIMELGELPEVEPNLSPADQGTAVHAILTSFYRQWSGAGRSRVSQSSLDEAEALMLEIARQELGKYSFQSPLWEATCHAMCGCSHSGPGYLKRFLEREAGEALSPLVPTCFEFSFGMKTSASDDPASVPGATEIAGPGGSEPLRIRGRIDRIDLSPEGYFLIYDYKTGAQHPKLDDVKKGKALQLPLYLLAFESITGHRGVAAGYYLVRKDVECRMLLCDETGKGLVVSRPKVTEEYSTLLDRSREATLHYICRIREGAFPLPCEEKCPNSYCEFRRICRFDPYRIFSCGEVS